VHSPTHSPTHPLTHPTKDTSNNKDTNADSIDAGGSECWTFVVSFAPGVSKRWGYEVGEVVYSSVISLHCFVCRDACTWMKCNAGHMHDTEFTVAVAA